MSTLMVRGSNLDGCKFLFAEFFVSLPPQTKVFLLLFVSPNQSRVFCLFASPNKSFFVALCLPKPKLRGAIWPTIVAGHWRQQSLVPQRLGTNSKTKVDNVKDQSERENKALIIHDYYYFLNHNGGSGIPWVFTHDLQRRCISAGPSSSQHGTPQIPWMGRWH